MGSWDSCKYDESLGGVPLCGLTLYIEGLIPMFFFFSKTLTADELLFTQSFQKQCLKVPCSLFLLFAVVSIGVNPGGLGIATPPDFGQGGRWVSWTGRKILLYLIMSYLISYRSMFESGDF